MIKKADSITLKEAREQERMNDFARQHKISPKEQQPRAREQHRSRRVAELAGSE